MDSKTELDLPNVSYWFDTQKLNNQLQVQETLSLVRPTPKERLFNRVKSMQKGNSTAALVRRIESLEFGVRSCFKELADCYFGLSKEQILQLPDEELEALFFTILERARKTSIFVKILYIFLPPIGWANLIFNEYSDSSTVRLTYSFREIKKMLGDELNLIKILRNLA